MASTPPSTAPSNPPPPGPPWDTPFAEAPFAFVDLEMTGLDPKRDRVIEICIERVRGTGADAKVDDRLYTLVRPEAGERGNVHVHGIADEALASAPTFAGIAERTSAILAPAVLVAHGASWDVAFLEAELARAGIPTKIPHYVDTLTLARRALGLPRHSLEALSAHFNVDRSRAHRADSDVAALRVVFERCIALLAPSTPRDLWQVRIAERRAREHIVAECMHAVGTGEEVFVAYRRRGHPLESLRMVLTAIDTNAEPPRVAGYELPSRSRRELRADRILRIDVKN